MKIFYKYLGNVLGIKFSYCGRSPVYPVKLTTNKKDGFQSIFEEFPNMSTLVPCVYIVPIEKPESVLPSFEKF